MYSMAIHSRILVLIVLCFGQHKKLVHIPFQMESKGRLSKSVKKQWQEKSPGIKILPKLNNRLRGLGV